MTMQPPYIVRSIFKGMLWNLGRDNNNIYLTFDDGPTTEITPWILDLLNKYDAKATFFCLGRNVERNPELLEDIKNAGHAIGNHSYSHLNGLKTTTKEYLADVNLARDLIDSKLFRPPYGKIKMSQYNKLKSDYKFVMWDVLTWDFKQKNTPEDCIKIVKRDIKPGSIVVFHDSVKAEENMRECLQFVLKNYSEKGFLFESIPNNKL